ncbi:uncharacterized protein LOC107627673 [Arachis ipaensis]|uniref:uncharacterized protein LOC107627673 n=1 Tax=Arachis ipaensis TaxID=130454 RepID=UPI0007AFC217|nr:uncharacterized protein LOC107627673 [Arachis ipaensis]
MSLTPSPVVADTVDLADSVKIVPLQVVIDPNIQSFNAALPAAAPSNAAAPQPLPSQPGRPTLASQNRHLMQTRSKCGIFKPKVNAEQPEGFTSSNPHQLCKLQRSLYSLKKAPRAWFTKLSSTLQKFGFTSTQSDISLFTRFTSSPSTYILVYVDDILVIRDLENKIKELVRQLHSTFSLKKLGEMHYFLGIEVTKALNGSITLKQTKYIKDLLKRDEKSNVKLVPTPMIASLKLSAFGDSSFNNPSLYRSIVGGLQYATITRLEISFYVNKVAQFLHNPLESHRKAIKRILRYLAGIAQYGLRFSRSTSLRIYDFCDSDWANDVDDRKSTNGYGIYLGSNLVSKASRKQSVVLKSSPEA